MITIARTSKYIVYSCILPQLSRMHVLQLSNSIRFVCRWWLVPRTGTYVMLLLLFMGDAKILIKKTIFACLLLWRLDSVRFIHCLVLWIQLLHSLPWFWLKGQLCFGLQPQVLFWLFQVCCCRRASVHLSSHQVIAFLHPVLPHRWFV